MENENNRHFPFGRKEAEGFAVRGVHDVRCVTGQEMPPGLLPASGPLGGGVSSPYMPVPAACEKPQR